MFSLKKFVLLAGAILLSTQVTYADVLYRQVFGNTPGASGSQPNTNFESVGWSGFWSPTAQTELQGSVTTPTTNYNNFGVSDSFGIPVTLTNVNTGSQAASTTNGFAFSSGFDSVSNNILFETSQFTLNQSQFSISTFSFYSGNTSNTFPNGMPGWRIAVQIDGNWYASATNLVQTINIASAAAFNTSGQQLIFNWTTAASAWNTLSFTPGSTLALGGVLGSSLPSDPITAFGLYSDPSINTNGVGGIATRRFDTYEIDGTAIVPEPSSVALVLIGFGTLLGFRRSRKA